MQAWLPISTCRNGDLIKPHLKVRPWGPNLPAGVYQRWKLVYQLSEMPLHIDIRLVSLSPWLWFFFPLSSESFMHFAAIKEKSSFAARCQEKFLWKILLRQAFQMKAKIRSIPPASQVYKNESPFYVILSIFLLLQDYLFISIFSRVNSIVFHDDVYNTFLWGENYSIGCGGLLFLCTG